MFYYNQENKNKVKRRDDENHSRSVLISNKKGFVDEINVSVNKQNNKSIYS